MRYGPLVRNLLGILAVVAIVVGPALAHYAVVPPLAGFAMFALGGILAILVALVSLVQLVRGRGLTLGGALALVAGVFFFALMGRGRGAPRINDFTTDLDDPPTYVAAGNVPANAGRDMAYPRDFAAEQRQCCADLHPARVAAPPAQAYERALAVAKAMPHWEVTRADPSSGTIEVVATSELFRFRDDVVLRVRPTPDGGSKVDVRSKSRDGKGDLGANAARIRDVVGRIEAAK